MSSPLLDPVVSSEWDALKARHLLNRAGFGFPVALAERLAEMGPEAAVERFLSAAEEERPPGFVIPYEEALRLRAEARGLPEEERRKKNQELRKAEREAMTKLQAWWLERMYTTESPLVEKMTLFWHGHFATSAQKVQASSANWQINDLFRRHATGNFKSLTLGVGQSPAMLRYLDNTQSTRKHPNENWARELMELFTMGPGHYTEDDIQNAARAFTGWSMAAEGRFQVKENVHDFGAKTFLGRTGNFDGWDIVDIIFEQPATAEFICRKLWTFFAYEEPEAEVVAGLAETMRESSYELRPVLRRMFLSRAFYGARARGRQIKSPVQFVLGLASNLGLETPPYGAMSRAAGQLGQRLFYPPNVKGWDGNRAWINANALLLRYNLPVTLVQEANRRARKGPSAMQAESMTTMAERAEKAVRAPWNPRDVLAGIEAGSAEECVRALERRFLDVPLRDEQRAVVVEALGTMTEKELRAALRLLLSTAEYQVC